jgi:uncharacterized protein (TIGR02246 family)
MSPHAVLDAIKSAFDRFDVEAMTGLFAERAIFLGTSMASPTMERVKIRAYFEEFFGGYAPTGLTMGPFEVEEMAGPAAILCGNVTYHWTLGGKADSMPARLSVILTSHNGQWLISHFHSSAQPGAQGT